MRKKLLSLLLIPLAFASANAQTDVTSTYLQNAGFDESGIWDSSSQFASTAGAWKIVGSPANGSSGAIGYANNTTMNDVLCGTNPEGGTTGGALNLSIGWGASVQYIQAVELPTGFYKLGYKAYNANTSASTVAKNLIGFIPDGGTIAYGSTTDFGTTTWTDELSTIIPGGSGNVSVGFVSNSGKGSGSSAKLFIDYVKLYSLDLTTYSESNPLDVTDIITRPDATKELGSWSITGGNTFHVNTWSGEGSTDGSNMITPFFEDWIGNGGELANATIVSTFSNIPAGTYRFTALVRTLNEAGNETPAGATMFVNQDGSQDVCGGSTCTNGTYGTFSATGTVGSDGVLKVGFKIKDATINWISFRDIKLEYLGTSETANSTALASLIKKAQNTPAATSDIQTTLTNAINEGNTATTADAISKAIVTLNTAIDKAEENIIDNFDFSSWTGDAPHYVPQKWTVGQSPTEQNYWNLSNSALEVWAPTGAGIGTFDIYQEKTGLAEGVYRIRVSMANGNNGQTAIANGAVGLYAQSGDAVSFAGCTKDVVNATTYSNYNVLVTVGIDGTVRFGLKNVTTMTARWFSADNFSLEYLGSSLETVSDADAQYLLNMGTASLWEQGIKPSILKEATDALSTFKSSKTMANYEAAQAALTAAYARIGKYVKIDETVAYTPEANSDMDVDLVRTFNAGVWNTFCVPFAISNADLKTAFGESVQVAEFTSYEQDGAATFTTMDEPAIKANTPVIIKGVTAAEDNTYSFIGYAIETGDFTVTQGDMKFVGTYTPMTELYTTTEPRYVIGSDNKIHATSSEYTTGINGTRAYIVAPAEATVKFVVDGAVTGIETINENGTNLLQGTIYTISGQRVNNVSKGGLYIVNGKKVFVK